jgi:hypothetical protein
LGAGKNKPEAEKVAGLSASNLLALWQAEFSRTYVLTSFS